MAHKCLDILVIFTYKCVQTCDADDAWDEQPRTM